jgi:DNA-binding response OmpR family regulator
MALVVEDEITIAAYLSDMLKELEFQVAIATTARSAMQLTQERKFEVAFIDLGLPDRSGLELMADLERQHHELPIIIATAYVDRVHRDMAESHRDLKVLAKPYQKTALIANLRNLGFNLPG